MSELLPYNAAEIFVEWARAEGGVGVIAATDAKGQAVIGLYPLLRLNECNGVPCWFQRRRLMTDILIGHAKETRRTIFIDVEVSARGLSLIVCVPFDVTHTYPRHSFAPWGSKRPPHSVKECGTPYMIDGFRLRKGGT